MALLHGDLIEIIDRYTMQGDDKLNAWQFRWAEIEPGATLTDIADTFTTDWIARYAAVQSSQLLHTDVTVSNLTNGLDFTTQATNIPGLIGGDSLPHKNAVGVKLTVATKVTRPGSKRLRGFSETDQTNGTLNTGTETALLGLISTIPTGYAVLGDPAGTGDIFSVVIGRLPAGGYDLTRVQDVLAVGLNTRLTTQV